MLYSRANSVGALSAAFVLGAAVLLAGLVNDVQADDAKPAKPAAPKVTYDEHIRPILREHCFSCHNQNGAKGGLSLDSYGAAMEGGSGGEVVFGGDLDSSRLWALVSHDDEPFMPPKQEILPAEKLKLIKSWIEGGVLENSGSKAKVRKQVSFALSASAAGGKPAGPAAMPEGVWRQPVVYTPRAAAISAIASSPWAPLAAIAGQKQISLYNTDTHQLLGVLPFPEGIPHILHFSQSGQILLAGGGRGGQAGSVVLYDVRSGKRLSKIGDDLDAVLAADINNTHTLVAMGGPNRLVKIYSTETGELLHTIKKHTDWVYSIKFSPDGVLLATSDRAGGVFVWEADTAREYLNLKGHKGAVYDLSWRADSNVLASASEDATIRLWEMEKGRQLRSWGAHGGGALSVEFTHDGRLCSTGRDRTTKIWDGNGKAIRSLPAFSEYGLEVTFSHDGKQVIAGDWSGEVRAWNAADGKQLALLPANPPTLQMAFDQASKQAAASQAALVQPTAALAVAETAAKAAAQAAATAVTQSNAAVAKAKQTRAAVAAADQAAKKAVAQIAPSQAAVAQAQKAAAAAQAKSTADKQKSSQLQTQVAKAGEALKVVVAEAAKATATSATAAKTLSAKAAAQKTAAEAAKAAALKAEQSEAERKKLADALAAAGEAERPISKPSWKRPEKRPRQARRRRSRQSPRPSRRKPNSTPLLLRWPLQASY